MKLKEVKKVLALSLAVALAVPGNVWAAEPAGEEASVEPEAQALGEVPGDYEARTGYVLPEGYHYLLDENGCVTFLEDGSPAIEADQPEAPAEETPEEPAPETPEEEVPEEPVPETPEEPAPETPEEPAPETPAEETPEESVPEAPAEEVPEEPAAESPEDYEARTGYVLPEGYHYILDGEGFIILLEDGSPQIEADAPAAPSSNEELISDQQIIEIPEVEKDFRFWTVARKYAFAVEKSEIKEEMDQESRSIGSLRKGGLCYILKEEEEGWLYVESGRVRGFIQTSQVETGEDAQKTLKKYQRRAKRKAAAKDQKYTGIEGTAPMAKELVSWQENEAFLYLRATVNQTVVDKDYAVTTASLLNIREEKDKDSRIVGTLEKGSLCYILADKDEKWVYIESGDVRGFVSKKYIKYDKKVQQEVEEKGEENFSTAEELIELEENQACYYTLTSVKSGVPQDQQRKAVVEFASQFIGNPYVWGGTSLTEGADCSGFVQSVFREYGYELPRVAEDQAQYGTKIPVEDAQPGDLVFYARDGYIYHVVLYAGDGKTIEAKGTKYGIVQDDLNTENAVWAARVLEDAGYPYEGGDLTEVNATEDMYGECLGNYKLTYYCSCELCCDKETGITATGTPVIEGQTIAVDASVIPYGTQVIINGHVFTAEDCGGAIKGNRIDIYVNDHNKALELGVDHADVYLVK